MSTKIEVATDSSTRVQRFVFAHFHPSRECWQLMRDPRFADRSYHRSCMFLRHLEDCNRITALMLISTSVTRSPTSQTLQTYHRTEIRVWRRPMVSYPMEHNESHIPVTHDNLAKDVDAVICVISEYVFCLCPRHILRLVVIHKSPLPE